MPELDRDILSVSHLTRAVRGLLEGHFGAVWVEGELSNLAQPGSGHLYFTLKDKASQVRCAMFRARNGRLAFRPANGDQVLVAARVSLYEPRGEFQLIVEHMEPAGEGALRLRFEALKRSLAAEGLFAEKHKQPLPGHPRAIGVVTSATGAAVRDILHVLARRNRGIPIILYPSPVQGPAAVPGLVQAIETANRRAEVDVLIVARGGGSLEDLWAFNEEAVVRAIFASRIPVVSGVGHEIDFTLADLVADQRAATPSAAAALCAPEASHLLQRVNQLRLRLATRVRAILVHEALRLRGLSGRLSHPGRRIEQHQQRLDEIARRLPQAMRGTLRVQQRRLAAGQARLLAQNPDARVKLATQRLHALQRRLPLAWALRHQHLSGHLSGLAKTLTAVSPEATLERGYALVTDLDGNLVRDAAAIQPGNGIKARVARGALLCRVEISLPEESR